MLYRICSVVRREETSPNGEGSIRRYFCGEAAAAEAAAAAVAAAGEAVADAGADKGAHRLRFGDAGLSRGSKSRVLFRVAPHAMAAGSRGPARAGPGRTGAGGPSDAPGGCGARDGGAAAGQVGEARGSRRWLGAAPERPGHPRRAPARSLARAGARRGSCAETGSLRKWTRPGARPKRDLPHAGADGSWRAAATRGGWKVAAAAQR